MAVKKYTLSIEQLNDIVSDAVSNALKKLDGLEIVDDGEGKEKPTVEVGEYQMKPRGHVFYSPAQDQYIIAVGSWIDNSPEAADMIIDEFDLPRDKTVIQKAQHWDIGQTWADII